MILVCGDTMIDRYLWADVRRISPEAPVPVATVHRIEERLGGAANVAANIAAMGSRVVEAYGQQQAPIVKIRVIGKNQQMLRVDFDSPQVPITPADLPPHDTYITLFSDYGKGALAGIQSLISALHGSIILVDPKGFDYDRYRGADLIKPNSDEMRELVGGWHTQEQLDTKAQNFRRDMDLQGLLLTQAAEGMTLYDAEGKFHVPAEAREVYDVTGAGDTAIAAFACAIDRGYTWRDATRVANRAAGIAVGHFGTYVAKESEVFLE